MRQPDHGAFRPDIPLRPSSFFAALLCTLAAMTVVGGWLSNLPWVLRASLAVLSVTLLLHAWRETLRVGLRHLRASRDDATLFELSFRDGRFERARYAGFALFGSLVVFVFVEREGWRNFVLGPRRFVVLRDATDADSFRRLRTWVRLQHEA